MFCAPVTFRYLLPSTDFAFADEATHHFSLLWLFRSQIASQIVFVTRWWLFKFFHSLFPTGLIVCSNPTHCMYCIFVSLISFTIRYLFITNVVIHTKKIIILIFFPCLVSFIYVAQCHESQICFKGFYNLHDITPSILRPLIWISRFCQIVNADKRLPFKSRCIGMA